VQWDLAKSRRDRFCRFCAISAERGVLRVPRAIANRAHTRAFRAILRDVPKVGDWSVERSLFELSGDFQRGRFRPKLRARAAGARARLPAALLDVHPDVVHIPQERVDRR